MESNLKSSGYKELLLKKLSYAVVCSVLFHILVIFLYICTVNFSIQPSEWLMRVFRTLTSFSTWLCLLPFSSIIFAQVVICAKDYVLRGNYEFSRFERFVATFSVRTFVIGLLHVVVGGLSVWLYLSLSGAQQNALYVSCRGKSYCLVESNFFMILSGLWTGSYFFLRVYVTHRNLIFPVIHQRKLLYFKSRFLSVLKESQRIALYPTIYYFLLYYAFGAHFRNSFANSFHLHSESSSFSLWLCLYVWIFSVLYIFNMNLMRFFFELFLTEPIEHPGLLMQSSETHLSEPALLSNIPILQHLACLDLFLLSMWSPQRRQIVFSLSQPGGHPHTWNCLIKEALKLIQEFTDTLNKSTDVLTAKVEKRELANAFNVTTNKLQLPFAPQSPSMQQSSTYPMQYVENMRRLTLTQATESLDCRGITEPTEMVYVPTFLEGATNVINNLLACVFEFVKNIRAVKYLFGELPEAHIRHCLKNGQLIVWTSQGIANIAVASLTEDPYGVVQKDLPAMISSLVELKQCVEKLNKIGIFSRKGLEFDEFSFKMKNSILCAVKRSLCNICRTFRDYVNELPLKKDVAAQLQCYL